MGNEGFDVFVINLTTRDKSLRGTILYHLLQVKHTICHHRYDFGKVDTYILVGKREIFQETTSKLLGLPFRILHSEENLGKHHLHRIWVHRVDKTTTLRNPFVANILVLVGHTREHLVEGGVE
ncbi:hypothetical protein AR158_C792R [Paramecium bursaria Chlorella virus AR158]|uniref:hypothetical protein n=1 Tax=Paramecium bursaria Chlorella virus AR158 TaxID=380598 RepID=UPI00015AA903|nr:hypothetical protein AR158_C792R [Paramecium bursaria Chlorella virus AR158]ABU44337.1 hypothetical protein AR158_C792R [Paramecium bursaria Chlorella virus AR158]